jgi:hypothetical protein
MTAIIAGIITGAFAGILSGLFGIGGGIVIVPALILALGFSQHKAQGTSLAALLLPVGALGAWKYHQEKNIDINVALALSTGLFAGALLGANIASTLDPVTMRRIFAVFLVGIAAYLWFKA